MEDNMLIVMHLKACAQIYDLANMLHDEMYVLVYKWTYEGWNFNSGNYLFTTNTK